MISNQAVDHYSELYVYNILITCAAVELFFLVCALCNCVLLKNKHLNTCLSFVSCNRVIFMLLVCMKCVVALFYFLVCSGVSSIIGRGV